jgi:hypothetical protein
MLFYVTGEKNMLEMRNKVIHYMMDIDHAAKKLFVIEGPISLMEFSQELQKATDISTPFELQRQAHKACNIARLRAALQKAMEHFQGQPLVVAAAAMQPGIYEFPLDDNKLKCEDELLEYIDKVF